MSEFIRPVSQTPENNRWLPEQQDDLERYQTNLELLASESRTLAKCYELAVATDPRLKDVIIVPEKLDNNGKSLRPAFARKPWLTESGKAEVHILFGDREKINQEIWEKVKIDPDFREVCRKLLYAPKGSTINKRIVSGIVFLHELGHVSDYFDNENDRENYEARIQAEKDSLPLGYLSDKKLQEKYDSGDAEFRQQVESLFGSKENAIAQYRTLRHQLDFEKKADAFVQKVIQNNVTGFIGMENNEIYKD
jgi:hypothetical protein